MARREFSKAVKAEIVRRAMHPQLGIICEGCGIALGKKPFEIDHTIADALILDKTRKLTAADGRLLGKACCHDPKTHGHDVPIIAKVKRVEARDMGITKPKGEIKSRGFAKTEKPSRGVDKSGLPTLPPRKLYEERS